MDLGQNHQPHPAVHNGELARTRARPVAVAVGVSDMGHTKKKEF